MNFLDINWNKTGTNIEEFWNNIRILDEKTGCINTNTSDITFYSIQDKKDDNFIGYQLKPYNIFQKFKSGDGLILGLKQRIINIPLWLKTAYSKNEELIKETYLDYSNRVLVSINNSEPCFIDMTMYRTLAKFLNYTGPAVNEASLERDIDICKLCEKDIPVNIIYIEDNGVKKLLTTLSSTSIYEPQIIIKDIHDNIINDINIKNTEYEWEISHQLVSLKMKYNNMILEIKNSNKGELAFTVNGYINNKKILSVKQKHNNYINTNNFTEEIKDFINEHVNNLAKQSV